MQMSPNLSHTMAEVSICIKPFAALSQLGDSADNNASAARAAPSAQRGY